MIITILAPCASNREKLCAVPFPKRKSKKQTLHWKKFFHIRNSTGRRTPFFELWCTICRHTTTSVSPLLYCWVTLLRCLFTFYPFLVLHITKKYVERRMTLLKRKQIYKAVIRHDGI